jgi:hypothetical protein
MGPTCWINPIPFGVAFFASKNDFRTFGFSGLNIVPNTLVLSFRDLNRDTDLVSTYLSWLDLTANLSDGWTRVAYQGSGRGRLIESMRDYEFLSLLNEEAHEFLIDSLLHVNS